MSNTTQKLSPLEAIVAVKELLSSPERWSKHYMWADSSGQPCSRHEASCFCLLGAITHICTGQGELFDKVYDIVHRVVREVAPGSSSIAVFNDSVYTPHEKLLTTLDMAINMARGVGQ